MKWDWKEWAKAAIIRALKTFAQTAAAGISVGVAFSEVDWAKLFSVAGVSFVLSLLTSLGGLPEVEKKPPDDEPITDLIDKLPGE